MTEGKRAGWYPDPSGLTKKFRWWNGEQWTVATANSLWENEPRNAQPYTPPPPGRHAAPVPPLGPTMPTVVEVDDLGTGHRRRWIIGVVAAVVLLGGAATAVALWLNRNDQPTPVATSPAPTASSPAASTSPAPSVSTAPPSTAPETTPAETPTPSALPAPRGGRLRFAPPEPSWRTAPTALRQDLANQLAMYLNTEELWDGKRNWAATIIAGDLPRSARGDAPGAEGDLPKTAQAAARWFLRTEWNSPPSYGPADGRAIEVDGRPAYRLRTQVAYSFKGLKSKHDNIDIVVIDYGPKREPGLVIATIPETHPQLSEAVEQALRTLHLEGATG